MAGPDSEDKDPHGPSNLLSQAIHVPSHSGLLAATENQVISFHLHMRPIQWYPKNHWHVPKSLEKIIPLPRTLNPQL